MTVRSHRAVLDYAAAVAARGETPAAAAAAALALLVSSWPLDEWRAELADREALLAHAGRAADGAAGAAAAAVAATAQLRVAVDALAPADVAATPTVDVPADAVHPRFAAVTRAWEGVCDAHDRLRTWVLLWNALVSFAGPPSYASTVTDEALRTVHRLPLLAPPSPESATSSGSTTIDSKPINTGTAAGACAAAAAPPRPRPCTWPRRRLSGGRRRSLLRPPRSRTSIATSVALPRLVAAPVAPRGAAARRSCSTSRRRCMLRLEKRGAAAVQTATSCLRADAETQVYLPRESDQQTRAEAAVGTDAPPCRALQLRRG